MACQIQAHEIGVSTRAKRKVKQQTIMSAFVNSSSAAKRGLRRGFASPSPISPQTDCFGVEGDSKSVESESSVKIKEDTGDETDELPIKTPTRFRKVKFEDSDDEKEAEDDGNEPLPRPFSARRRICSEATFNSDSDGDPPIMSSNSKKRRLANRLTSPKVTTTRLASTRVRARNASIAEKMKGFEKLRRQRTGEYFSVKENEESCDGEQKALYDSDSELEVLSTFEDEEEDRNGDGDDSKEQSPKTSRKRRLSPPNTTNAHDSESPSREEDSLDDFIDDDDEGVIGAPSASLDAQVPFQFSADSRKELAEHFRDVMVWLLMRYLNPDFDDRNHELYQTGWSRLDAATLGLADSKFASSIWTADFKYALQARPNMDIAQLGSFKRDVHDKCQACNRSGHKPSFAIQLTGSPYIKNHRSPYFLMDLDYDENDEDDDSNAEFDVDEDGRQLPKTDEIWYVGRTCASNAQAAHGLYHWRKKFEGLVDIEIAGQQLKTAANVLEREAMNHRDRAKMVQEIIRHWEDDGIIDALWEIFALDLAEAQATHTKARKGGTKWAL